MSERTPLTVEQSMALEVGSKVVVLTDVYESYSPGDVLTVKQLDTSDNTILAGMVWFSPHDVALYVPTSEEVSDAGEVLKGIPHKGQRLVLRKISDVDITESLHVNQKMRPFFNGKSIVVATGRADDDDETFKAQFPDGEEWWLRPEWCFTVAPENTADATAPEGDLLQFAGMTLEEVEAQLFRDGGNFAVIQPEGMDKAVMLVTREFLERAGDLLTQMKIDFEFAHSHWGFPCAEDTDVCFEVFAALGMKTYGRVFVAVATRILWLHEDKIAGAIQQARAIEAVLDAPQIIKARVYR